MTAAVTVPASHSSNHNQPGNARATGEDDGVAGLEAVFHHGTDAGEQQEPRDHISGPDLSRMRHVLEDEEDQEPGQGTVKYPNDGLSATSSNPSSSMLTQSTAMMCPNSMSLAAPSPNALGPR
jgi:hypothetical protein